MRIILLIYLCLLLASCFDGNKEISQKYYTWDGLEPDRWSSLWLLKRHIDPLSELSIVPVGAQVYNAIAIATPESKVKRTHGFSNFENLLQANKEHIDPALMRIGKIINEIEISPWRSSTPHVAVVERQFRALQFKYNRIDVPHSCYAGFFDILYAVLLGHSTEYHEPFLSHLEKKLHPDIVCQASTEDIVIDSSVLVPEYPVDYILKMINANKTVVFVDTREDDEYDEQRIPGAINLKLREVNTESVKLFSNTDLVISYCIKDFRGYEVALALSKVGVENIGIMKPYGLKGWIDLGLPVANADLPESIAIIALKQRAAGGI